MIEYHPLLYQPFCYFTLSPPYKYMYAHLPHCSFSQVLPGLASCLVLCPALSGGIVSVFAVAPVFLVLSAPPPPLIRRPSVSGSGVVSHPSYPLLAWLVHPSRPSRPDPLVLPARRSSHGCDGPRRVTSPLSVSVALFARLTLLTTPDRQIQTSCFTLGPRLACSEHGVISRDSGLRTSPARPQFQPFYVIALRLVYPDHLSL